MTTEQIRISLKVQRVDRPRPELLALSLYGAGRRLVLLIHMGPERVDLGVVTERPRGAPADGHVRQLRKRLVGARLRSLRRIEGGLCLNFERGPESTFLRARSGAPDSRDLRPLDQEPAEVGPEICTPVALLEPDMLARGRAMLDAIEGDALERQRRTVERALGRAVKKLRRREQAIERDLERIDSAPALRADAQLILANLQRLRRGDERVTAMDWTLEPPRERSLELDPRLPPKEQAERLFHRARRLGRGRTIAETRLREASIERTRLEAGLLDLRGAEDEQGIVRLMRGLGLAAQRPPEARGEQGARLPYRRYLGSGGRAIWVGRGARDNDALTLHHARPWDLWLHARDVEGAHVIIPRDRGEGACPSELLIDAASLAAHHSRARGQSLVDVQYVARRHVRKPRGFPAGAVRVEREKVVRLRVDAERLRRLLKSRSDA